MTSRWTTSTPERLQTLLREGVRGAIELLRAEQGVPGLERRHERRRDRGHSGAECLRGLGTLEVGEHAVELLDGRVAEARVEEAVLLLAHHAPEGGGVVEGERRGRDDGLDDRLARSVGKRATVNRAR